MAGTKAATVAPTRRVANVRDDRWTDDEPATEALS